MRLCPISMIPKGAVLGRDVSEPGKGILLRAGVELTPKDIRNLFKRGILSLYIQDSITSDTSPDDIIADSTRIHAVDEVYQVLTHKEELKQDRGQGLAGIASVSEKMVEDIYSGGPMSIPTHDLRGYDDYTFRHSVNVTAISLVVGRAMNLTRKDLNELAIGGLLHDIGKMDLAPSILNKRGRLDKEEFAQIQRHPVWGYETLSQKTNTPPRVWAMARQHHEALSGDGYPDHRSAKEIHSWAKIITVADIWDALRSDRPYKRGWPQKKVIDLLTSEEMKPKLDAKVLKVFLQHVQPYPVGTLVRLSTRELAVVQEQVNSFPEKPIVKVLAAPDGKFYTSANTRIINLALDGEIVIAQTVA